MLIAKRQKTIKKNCTYKMHPDVIQMLDKIKLQTGVSRGEIIAQLIESYYLTNEVKKIQNTKKSKKESEVSSRVATNKSHFAE